MLLKEKKVKLPDCIFSTRWQDVIFYNYGFVSTERISSVLNMPVKAVEKEAERLGLGGITYNPKWEKKGFLTLIRNVWFILPYSQIMQLFDMDENRLSFILTKEDFFGLKLGNFKPVCEKCYYMELTEEQKEQTAKKVKLIKKYKKYNMDDAFDFYKYLSQGSIPVNETSKGIRIVHGYTTPCGDAFMQDCDDYMPDALLEQYQKNGINAVWAHGILSSLSPYPFDYSVSKDYLIRRKKMKILINKLSKYGIKLYLYLNEPRALDNEIADKYENFVGHRGKSFSSFCMQKQEAKDYLYNAVKDLLNDIPEIGGFISITMSENQTHCQWSAIPTQCPLCANKGREESSVIVNNVIMKAIKDSRSNTKLIANLWGWSKFNGWSKDDIYRGIKNLDKDIIIMCISEFGLRIEKGGEKSEVIDYSISNPGPSEESVFIIETANKLNRKIMAKIQINNSWECSFVPFLPAFDCVYEHLKNLSVYKVEDYMLTWTLGGYPSPIMNLVSSYANRDNFMLDEWYFEQFGEEFTQVKKASELFCKGFREYPFSVIKLYCGPHNRGVANRWSLEKEELESTMVCYSYDDYKTWIAPYSFKTYINQLQKMLRLWEKSIGIFKTIKDESVRLICSYVETAYCHLLADKLQTEFSYYKQDIKNNAEIIKKIILQEKQVTDKMIRLSKIVTVGFEVSNQYFYNDRNLKTKIIELDTMLSKI